MLFDLTPLILDNQVQEFRVLYYFVPGYQDIYCLGSDGSLWSRHVKVGNKWVVGGPGDWRESACVPDSSGRLVKILCINGTRKTVKIHKLVASLFIGPCPAGMECCHNDGVCTNNNVCNLRYDTHKGNKHDQLKHGTHLRGERSYMAVLTQVEVDLIREKYATGRYSLRQLGKEFGVDYTNISKIVRNETWVKYEE
jgi:hypothetical protein